VTRQRGHKQPTPSMPGLKGNLYTNAKPALQERPYYQNIGFKATPRGPAHPTLTHKSCKQLRYIKQHNISYEQGH
jgi:hypothetical protein